MVGLMLLVSAFGVPTGTLVDQVVAVVDKEVVTQSELLIEARIALALRHGDDAVSATLDETFMTSFRDYLVNQLLVSEQARRFGAADVAEQEVDAQVTELSRRFSSPASFQSFLRRFGVGLGTVRAIVRRDLRNERYVRERLRLRLIGQGELDRLGDEQYDRALRAWLGELRATADIRLLGPDGELERN